jgi:DNA-binding NtrC family response regulator
MSQKPTPVALIVNPDPHMAWAMQQVLLPEGWQAIIAHSGASAMMQAATAPIRLSFVSAHLPDMESDDLAKRLRQVRPEATSVVISDFYYPGDEETRQVLRHSMFFNFIAKPFDLAEISALAQRPMEHAYQS